MSRSGNFRGGNDNRLTDLLFVPARVQVNKVEVVTLLRFLLKQYCILPKISPLQKYKLPPLFDLQVIARIFTVLVSPHSYATKIASSARTHE